MAGDVAKAAEDATPPMKKMKRTVILTRTEVSPSHQNLKIKAEKGVSHDEKDAEADEGIDVEEPILMKLIVTDHLLPIKADQVNPKRKDPIRIN